MNKETYEALKKVVLLARLQMIDIKEPKADEDINQVLAWIGEVAKDYEDEDHPNPEVVTEKAEAIRDGLREDGINV